MDLQLHGARVIVTGGSKGIGLACARRFVEEGARVAIVSRSAENLAAAAGVVAGVQTVAANLSDEGDAQRAVDAVVSAFGDVDVLVNCAGAAKRMPADELTPGAWRRAMDAKFHPYMNVTDPVIKRMAARGRGVVINVIGAGGKVASPIHLAGGAANAALMLATTGLAAAYARKGVRVVGVNPALTNTERVADGLKADAKILGISEEEAFRRSQERIGMGRMAEPEEIAEVVVFLASPRASYMTGANITMDGAQYPVIL
jgi:NAD(P)-dependent dehydrogenase (short-subunit alcohol dehydrogenase family)